MVYIVENDAGLFVTLLPIKSYEYKYLRQYLQGSEMFV